MLSSSPPARRLRLAAGAALLLALAAPAAAGCNAGDRELTGSECKNMCSASFDDSQGRCLLGKECGNGLSSALCCATDETDSCGLNRCYCVDDDDNAGDDADADGRDGEDGEDSGDDDDDSLCFPADATVRLRSGAAVRMDALAVGDEVAVGAGRFSPVFACTHRLAAGSRPFVVLETDAGAALTATPGHYLYVGGVLAPAASVRVGDVLTLGGGGAAVVTAVRREPRAGLYNPQTLHGDVVVDGVLASTYTTAVAPAYAHALLAPLRGVFALFGVSSSAMEAGGGAVTRFFPVADAAVVVQ